MKTINYAIDLGTTNSLIAKYNDDSITLYNNPLGLKQTLPSCVAYRGERIVIGDKALDYLEKDGENVCMLFKRKMGSQETYYIPSINKEVSPIELSSLILNELKNFVKDDTDINSVVITIPASFDTIQSNATKKAGLMAGFKEVVLLQEPIAACLAFANKSNIEVTDERKWIVYDFGGGTFDVALVSVNDRELKVIKNLWTAIKQKDTNFKGLYFELLKLAEEAKKELSQQEQTIVELDLTINGQTLMDDVTINRSDFEAVIVSKVDTTINFINEVITNNGIQKTDIDRIILIGGSTYVPLIREKITNEIGVFVDSSINPTSAVVEGAAYYAGSKPAEYIAQEAIKENTKEAINDTVNYSIFYEQVTKDEEELITVKVENTNVINYRLTRLDGGYDSGVKKINNQGFSEFVPLLKDKLNRFQIQFINANNMTLKSIDNVTINHGSYNIQGQPLPNDICIEIDDIDASTTRLEKIFGKGSILPLKKKIYKTASKSIVKNSDANLIINIIEGRSGGLPSSGLSIGYIEISGKELEDDLIKGTDIEIEIEVTESRDIKTSVYLQTCDQEFNNVFNPSERAISISKINMEINTILNDVEEQIKVNNIEENFEFSQLLEEIRTGLVEVQIESSLIEENDVSDKKYQLDDIKRKLIHEFDNLTRNKLIVAEIELYNEAKDSIEFYISKSENESFTKKYQKIIENEKAIINSGNKYLIRSKIKELDELYSAIIHSSDENFISYFLGLKYATEYSNQKKANRLINEGDKALEKQDYKTLRYIVYSLYAMLPDIEKEKQKLFKDDSKTGLS